MVIAWTAAFHAYFYRKGVNPWYKKKGGRRYETVDGDKKHWELAECIRQYFLTSNPPERKNLEFLIGIRNKIEHRHLPQLDATLYGECQSCLMNLEEFLVTQFGAKHALEESLAISLQFSQVMPSERQRATRKAVNSSVGSVTEYIDKFRAGLTQEVANSMKYAFSVFLVPKVAGKLNSADVAVTFVKVDEASPEELERLQKLNILIRDKHIPIANLNLYKAGDVVAELSRRLSIVVNMHAHTKAWQHFGVRPSYGAPKPDATRGEYCVYDAVHRDYVYTQAWIEMLARELAIPEKYREITGADPKAKTGTQSIPAAA